MASLERHVSTTENMSSDIKLTLTRIYGQLALISPKIDKIQALLPSATEFALHNEVIAQASTMEVTMKTRTITNSVYSCNGAFRFQITVLLERPASTMFQTIRASLEAKYFNLNYFHQFSSEHSKYVSLKQIGTFLQQK